MNVTVKLRNNLLTSNTFLRDTLDSRSKGENAECKGAEVLSMNTPTPGSLKLGSALILDSLTACGLPANYTNTLWYMYRASSSGCLVAEIDPTLYGIVYTTINKGFDCEGLECVQIAIDYDDSKTIWKALANETYYITVAAKTSDLTDFPSKYL
jgi:hypothetical protein